MKKSLITVFALLLPIILNTASNENLLLLALGDYNIFHTQSSHNTGVGQIEIKGLNFYKSRYVNLRPFAAAMLNFQASFWIGGGINFDLFHQSPFVITLGLGPGYFAKGHGKRLGYPLEIRSSIDLAYRFFSDKRLGLQFYHLSNASFSPKNPGVENLMLFYAIPF